MKRFIAALVAIGLLSFGWTTPSFAQQQGQLLVVTTCGTQTYPSGVLKYGTQDTTGKACGNASGGGGGSASYTAAAAPFSVAAGVNKPAWIDTANSSQGVEICKPGTVTCIDPTLPSGILGVDGANIATLANPFPTTAAEIPATSGGLLACTFEVAASDNHQNCGTNAAHQVYAIQGYSIHTVAMFMRLYNAASFNGCNSATNLVWEGQIPAPGTTGGGFTLTFPNGLAFASGIGVCVTGAYGNTSTTSATASVASVNIQYK